jgi:hypothetical protein
MYIEYPYDSSQRSGRDTFLKEGENVKNERRRL